MRTTGTVKWFNDAKGFGFVTPANGEKDWEYCVCARGLGNRGSCQTFWGSCKCEWSHSSLGRVPQLRQSRM